MSHRVATNVITNARVADPRRRGQLIASDAAHPAFLPFNVAFPVSFLGQLFARESHVIMFREHLYAVERVDFPMASASIMKVRTANLPRFQLTPKEATFLMTVVGLANFVFGILIGFML